MGKHARGTILKKVLNVTAQESSIINTQITMLDKKFSALDMFKNYIYRTLIYS